MRVLVFHGYLLRGTGSNVYNAELAAALLDLGHEVHLLCQERDAAELEFVGSVADWDSGELRITRIREAGCTVYRPNIGGLLPVYVPDRYEGVEARPFQDLTGAELERYLEANVSAVVEVAARAKPDLALANHLVMGPAILARALAGADIPYAVKIHGSALEYTVKPHPRFLPYARQGLAPAKAVLVGSGRDAEHLWEVLGDESLRERTRLGTPGVDLDRFRPWPASEAPSRLRALADQISRAARERPTAAPQADPATSSFSREDSATAGALLELAGAAASGPLIAFVGKLILSKGIDLLLAAWPMVLEAVPSATLAVVGFGEYEPAVERWIEALSAGDLAALRALADAGPAAAGGTRAPLQFMRAFLEELERSGDAERYLAVARSVPERVVLTGRLEHSELAVLLPACEALVVPSTFAESFGMVVVEAAASGTLPISASHSGLAEVSGTLAGGLPEPFGELLTFPLGPGVVRSIAKHLVRWLSAPADVHAEAREALRHSAAARYGWAGIARDVLAAARGELDSLALPV